MASGVPRVQAIGTFAAITGGEFQLAPDETVILLHPPCTFSRFFNRDGEGMPAKRQSHQGLVPTRSPGRVRRDRPGLHHPRHQRRGLHDWDLGGNRQRGALDYDWRCRG